MLDVIFNKVITIRSSRKTIAIEISHKGIVVRAPHKMSDEDIAAFIKQKEKWIERTLQKIETRRSEASVVLTSAEIHELAEKAMAIIPEKVKHFCLHNKIRDKIE